MEYKCCQTAAISAIGKLIRAKRAPHSLSCTCKKLGISKATLSRVERGYLPDLKTFVILCRFLNTSADALLLLYFPKD